MYKCHQTHNKFNGMRKVDKPEDKAWRRLRDMANKDERIRGELVKLSILGGLAPSTIRCLD